MDLSIETTKSGSRNNRNVLYDAEGNIRIPKKGLTENSLVDNNVIDST